MATYLANRKRGGAAALHGALTNSTIGERCIFFYI
jgi:hypothetical protein